MSQLNINTIRDASGGNNAVLYGVAAPSNSMGFRNRIINGDMRIDQRNNGASVTPANGQYLVDRWNCYATQASKFTVQQNAGAVTPPSGFSKYLGVTSSSSYSVASGDYFSVNQPIEGFNTSDFALGTAGASHMTVSFWVRSSIVGTFGGSLQNGNQDYCYPFSYTISAANTWEQKTVIISAPTSGTWFTTTQAGVYLSFSLGVGSTYSGTAGSWGIGLKLSATGATSVVGTSGATFYITGVQLEAGTVASPFERRDYGRELMMCQRYYEVTGSLFVGLVGASGYPTGYWKVTKRANPTLAILTTGIGSPAVAILGGSGTAGFYQSVSASTDTNAAVSGSSEL